MIECDPDLIACQISTVTEAIGSWNWNSFVSTVIATAIGALIGLAGVWWGFRLQRSHRYREVLDDSVVEAIDALITYARHVYEHNAIYLEYLAAQMGDPTKSSAPVEPDVMTATVRLAVVEMRARGADQKLVSDARVSFELITSMPDYETQAEHSAELAGALSAWRSRTWSKEEVRGSIRKLGRERATENAGDTEYGS